MHKVKGMRKAQAKEKMLFVVGVIVICLLALVFVVRFISPSLESSTEGQAKVLANMIAISANTLSTMDQGKMYKDFGLKEPLIVEITNEGGISSVKVVYDEAKGKSYSVPLLVNVESLNPIRVQAISVIKDITGKIRIEGEILDSNYLYTDVQCAEPSPEQKNDYVTKASEQTEVKQAGVTQAWIKAVIRQESSFMHCKNGYILKSSQGALGLMQLMPKTASGLGVDPLKPDQNVMGGARYLAQMKKQYVDMDKALAAYNWGPGNLDKIKDYPDWKTSLPAETSDFIAKVNGYYNACYTASACNPKECVVC